MGPVDVIKAPLTAVRLGARAADDLHAVAERARQEPDLVTEARERLESLGEALESLVSVGRSLEAVASAIVTGGSDLRRTGESLDAHTVQIVAGGEELTAVARELSCQLAHIRAALPPLLRGLDSVEELEESVGAVAATVEPLQGVTRGVGRMSERLSRR